jgi:hypothetical protein
MVTARKTAATPAAKKSASKGGALVKYDEKLAALAVKAKKSVANIGGGDWISCKGGKLSFGGNDVPGSAMDIVELSSCFENHLYEGKYDPNNPGSPVCFAFAFDEEDLKPHEKSSAPQAESCAECEHNQWGSGDGGTGKSCKNVRRLGLIPADALDGGAAGVKEAPIAWFKVPVTSVKGYANYVKQVAALEKPPLAFVTTLSASPDPKTQVKVSFNAKEEIADGELIGALIDRSEAVDSQIMFPYDPPSAQPAKPAGRSRPSSRPAAPAVKKPPARGAAAASKPAAKTTAPAIKKPAGKKY